MKLTLHTCRAHKMSALFPTSIVLTQDSAGVCLSRKNVWVSLRNNIYSIALLPPSLLALSATSKSTSTPECFRLVKRSARLMLVRRHSTRESRSVFLPNHEFFPPTKSILLLTKRFLGCGLRILCGLSGCSACRLAYGNRSNFVTTTSGTSDATGVGVSFRDR